MGVTRTSTVLIAAASLLLGSGGAAPARSTPSPVARTGEESASTRAARTGMPVELVGERAETRSVFANPDGSFSVEQHARPIRVRRDGGWVPVDATLRGSPDGSLSPVATRLGLRLSGGGAGPLVTLSDGDRSVSLFWPGPLPAPVVDGPTATYLEVIPGVDLAVTADVEGFTQVLVVKNRQAAHDPKLALVRFGTVTRGVALSTDPDGTLRAADPRGDVVFRGPAPTMWDSGGHGGDAASRLVAPARGARQAVLRTEVGRGDLTVAPDLSMVDYPMTRFPVYVDPSFAGGKLAWVQVWKESPDWSDWNGGHEASVGFENDPCCKPDSTVRVFWRMDSNRANGRHVLRGFLRTHEFWAWSCDARPVEVWLTGGIGSDTTWNRQPVWDTLLASVNTAKKRGYGCGEGDVEFDVTAGVQRAAREGWPDLTLGMKAANEGDPYGWKKFNNDPTLVVDYNSYPGVPDQLAVDGKGCVAGAGRPFIGTTTPRLQARLSDPDSGQVLKGDFGLAALGAPLGSVGILGQDNVANGGTAMVTIPGGLLANGGSYYFQSRAYDYTDTGNWAGGCEFTVDTDRPGQPPTVSSTDYPADGNVHGGQGRTGTFTLGAAGVSDVASYLYGWSDPPTTSVAASQLGGAVGVAATPPRAGLNTLYVKSVDRAGNPSDRFDYRILVGSATGPVGRWSADEGTGTTLADSSGAAHPVTLSGATSWADGRVGGPDRAVTFDGASGAGATGGPVVRTDQSFSVAAWVRTTATGGWRTALSQIGAHTSAFFLQCSAAGWWRIAMPRTDTDGPANDEINSAQPCRVGTWTHLAASYDTGDQQVRLYVNGALAGQVAHAASWTAGGALRLGWAQWDSHAVDFWAGQIDDVRVWDRVVDGAELRAITNQATLVGAWDLDGSGADSSGYGHPATAFGGATWATGHDGLGALATNGSTGYAGTPTPVLHTDQSFTVAAWVQLSAAPGTWVTAVSQNGATNSSFVLASNGSQWAFALHGADAVGTPANRTYSTQPIQAGVWTHLTGVHDASLHQIRLYVNGQVVATANDVLPYDARSTWDVGRAKWENTWRDWWPGSLDDVRVYLGVLSDTQIVDLANQ